MSLPVRSSKEARLSKEDREVQRQKQVEKQQQQKVREDHQNMLKKARVLTVQHESWNDASDLVMMHGYHACAHTFDTQGHAESAAMPLMSSWHLCADVVGAYVRMCISAGLMLETGWRCEGCRDCTVFDVTALVIMAVSQN